MPAISESEARARLAEVPGWDVGDKSLVRKLALPSFPDAIAFVVKVAFVAEAADHHPDILIHYRRVTLTLWTHTEGGITDKAFALAKEINKLIK
jgi:4a-hydroxytetrahydrobiopterin dehydratase